MKKTIVVSAINLRSGGTLSILQDCLECLSENFSQSYRIIALVHDAKLTKYDTIEFIEYPKSIRSWFFRLYYEYVHFYILSLRIRPHLWLSLHDMTPNVQADIRAVYCHNPSPFYTCSLKTFRLEYKFALFCLFYKYLYGLNIGKNKFVIVQQGWIRREFERLYGIRNIVVAYPRIKDLTIASHKAGGQKFTFLYPALPREFKNVEVVAEAASKLNAQGKIDFEVVFTIAGTENDYARHLLTEYSMIPSLRFIGLQPRDEVFRLYQKVDALIFPSKLETWGMPISEFKNYDKPMLLADLPYARETAGKCERVKFFDPDNADELAIAMEAMIEGQIEYDTTANCNVEQPFAVNWQQLFSILLS